MPGGVADVPSRGDWLPPAFLLGPYNAGEVTSMWIREALIAIAFFVAGLVPFFLYRLKIWGNEEDHRNLRRNRGRRWGSPGAGALSLEHEKQERAEQH
jgi:hypothetical protein